MTADVSLSCGGACCAVFPVGRMTHDDYRERLVDIADGAYIADMLVPLGPEDAAARYAAATGRVLSEVPGWGALAAARGILFTCSHWDPGTGLCGAYEARPGMCRSYPYGSACAHCGVTAGEVPRGRALSTAWRLDRRRRAYRWTGEGDPPVASLGAGWTWDGEALRPVDDGSSAWDWRRRRWSPLPEPPSGG